MSEKKATQFKLEVRKGKFDYCSTEEQMCVHIQIPSFEPMNIFLKPLAAWQMDDDNCWPQVAQEALILADTAAVYQDSADDQAKRRDLQEWLAVDENFDAFGTAWATRKRNRLARQLAATQDELDRLCKSWGLSPELGASHSGSEDVAA